MKYNIKSNDKEVQHILGLLNRVSLQRDELENKLDSLIVEKWDNVEKINNLTLQINSLQSSLEGARSSLNSVKNSALEDTQTQNIRCSELKRELERVHKNHIHATQTIAELNTTIALVKKEIEKLRAAKVSEDHLARKLVLFADENAKLKDQLQRLSSTINSPSAEQVPSPEIKQYQAQTTRLLEERATYDCQAETLKKEPCGKCLKCQLAQTKNILAQTTENLRVVTKQKTDDRVTKSLWDVMEIQSQALRKIAGSLKFWKMRDIARSALYDSKIKMSLAAFGNSEIAKCDDALKEIDTSSENKDIIDLKIKM